MALLLSKESGELSYVEADLRVVVGVTKQKQGDDTRDFLAVALEVDTSTNLRVYETDEPIIITTPSMHPPQIIVYSHARLYVFE